MLKSLLLDKIWRDHLELTIDRSCPGGEAQGASYRLDRRGITASKVSDTSAKVIEKVCLCLSSISGCRIGQAGMREEIDEVVGIRGQVAFQAGITSKAQ